MIDPGALEQSIWSVPHRCEEYIRALSQAVEGTVDEREERETVGSSTSGKVDGMFAEC